MASIFGPLDKRQRAAQDAFAAADTELSFEERADFFNDLLEEDATTFPLLACPPEVLSAVLLLLEAAVSLRMRPLCSVMCCAVDANVSFWNLITVRDFADLGGLTKHYRGLRTLADAWDDSRAVRRLEWDPLMICAPPQLRYALLATGEVRRRLWNEHGHALGAGWAWFCSKVCRRMAAATFLRWASLQHGEADVRQLMGALGKAKAKDERTVSFRCGRSDAVTLSAEAAHDIYETVQRWHDEARSERVRAARVRQVPGVFSVTPTLDAAAADRAQRGRSHGTEEVTPTLDAAAADGAQRGRSHGIEEAQLRLALELSKQEADPQEEGGPRAEEARATPEPAGLPLRIEGHALVVFLKDHCLAEQVGMLPESLEKSVEHVVRRMTTPSTWGLLYESVTEELRFRSKAAAHWLCTEHAKAVDGLLRGDISLRQERMCLPIWRSSAQLMMSLSKLRAAACDDELRQARCGLLRQASLEWRELEELTEFMDGQLAPLELAIDNFRGACDSKAHTPHVRDVGRLMFRNFCLLDSRVFRPLCLAAYALVHEVHSARGLEERRALVELLEELHEMLAACDVADDHLSTSKRTKDAFVEHLVVPISAALEHLAGRRVRHRLRRPSLEADGL